MILRSALIRLAAVFVCGAAAATAVPPLAHAQGYPSEFPLDMVIRGMEQQNDSGQVGVAGLRARGNSTEVYVHLDSEPRGAREPAHIHRGHSCATIDPKPAYPLNPVVNGWSRTLVHAPISKLLSGNYAINVHQSASNLKHYVSCGHLYGQSG